MRKLLLIIFFSSTVLAQDDLLSLSLNEAVEYGIENNRNLRNAEREIQMAFKERWKTIAIGLPNVSLELNYLNNRKVHLINTYHQQVSNNLYLKFHLLQKIY